MRYYFVMGQLSTGKFENFIGNKESLYNQYLLLLPNCFEKKNSFVNQGHYNRDGIIWQADKS